MARMTKTATQNDAGLTIEVGRAKDILAKFGGTRHTGPGRPTKYGAIYREIDEMSVGHAVAVSIPDGFTSEGFRSTLVSGFSHRRRTGKTRARINTSAGKTHVVIARIG